MIGLTASAQQSELKLTFDRSGDNVTVNVSGVEGVTATVVSKSHDWKDLGVTNANTILCPNVNGNTDPTITWALQLNGVPANYKLKGMGLDIHALNGGGNYQDPADNVSRHWNVVVAQGETTVANFADIEISQGSEDGRTMNNNHKVHAVEVADAPATTDPMTLYFIVTKGSENKGCFFGLSEVTLTYDVEEVEVPATPLAVESVYPDFTVRELSEITVNFNAEIAGQFDPYSMTAMKFKKGNSVAAGVDSWTVEGNKLTMTLSQTVTEAGEYTLVIPEGLITRKSDGAAYSGELTFTLEEEPVVVPDAELAETYKGTLSIDFMGMMMLDIAISLDLDKDLMVMTKKDLLHKSCSAQMQMLTSKSA